MTKSKKKTLAIVDISSFIFRAFYAVRLLHAPDGTPVNAVHGVLSMMLKLLEKYQPTHLLLARDSKGGSFRNEMYDLYKANRSEPPEELIPQFDLIKQLIDKLEFPNYQIDNYEADDVIGSLAVQWEKDFDEIMIVSGDKDLMQFVNDKVVMVDTMKDKIYDREGVYKKMGVWPEQIVDYLSMLGDTSDNIPGMKGIGAKGAAKILEDYKTLDAAIENSDSFTNKRVKNAFENHVEDGKLSRKLIKIVTDLELGHTPDETKLDFYPTQELLDFLKGLGFKTSLKKLQDIKDARDHEEGRVETDNFRILEDREDFESTVVSNKDFDKALKLIEKHERVFIETAFVGHDNLQGIVSIAVSVDGKHAYYFPFGHIGDEDLFADNDIPNLSEGNIDKLIDVLISDDKKTIVGAHLKKFFAHCYFNGKEIKAKHFDIYIANYLTATANRNNIATMAEAILGHHVKYQESKNEDLSNIAFFDLVNMQTEKVCLISQLEVNLYEKIIELELLKVHDEIENPLTPLLARLEAAGVHLNTGMLKKLDAEYSEVLAKIKADITKICGEEVNLKSPKQVGELLFEKLGLPVVKRTKTGYSTDVEVLSELDKTQNSPIPGMIIQYRELEKLLSTYIKVLPNLVNEKSKKLHTHFNQAVTATGRLSSDRPNLQNIPVRSEHGKKIRKAFMATPGNLLLAADYSQVELRLLAHFSNDPTMIKAFKNDLDIHSQTASEVQGIPLDQVTSVERSKAKAVNFGLMYGQSSFGLAKALGISRKEAKDYITGYFENFSKVKGYLDGLKDECSEKGYAITYFGRKRFLPDIHSQNRTIRANAERMAINSPIQGTAADIIKLAMSNIQKRIEGESLKSKMILQVHDELIFDVPESEMDLMQKLVREEMEGVVELKIPLKVDMGLGVNWYDLK